MDNVLISIAELLNPYFHKFGATANFITLTSSAFVVLTAFALRYDYYAYAALFYFIQYFFECMDGNYARTCNQMTFFGDYFNHIKHIRKNKLVQQVYLSHLTNFTPSMFAIKKMIEAVY